MKILNFLFKRRLFWSISYYDILSSLAIAFFLLPLIGLAWSLVLLFPNAIFSLIMLYYVEDNFDE